MNKKKLLALLMALVMTFSLVPVTAFATEATVSPIEVNGIDESVYLVYDGFYQDGATYDATTDFYITNLNGLRYFRDWVNGRSSVMNDYYGKGFLTLTLDSFATSAPMSGKNVHLLSDIDLTGEVWQPIGPNSGAVPDKFNGNWKAHFYGSFYGHNHIITNMDTSDSDQGDKWSSWPQGFFGSIATAGCIDGLVFVNPKVVSKKYAYAGVVVGDAGTNPWTISNCSVTGNITVTGGYSGGICGIGNVNISNCTVDATGTISGNSFAGGLVGAERCSDKSNLSISNNAVKNVEITSSQFAGGLVGAMAAGAAGTTTIANNSLSYCKVNGAYATENTIIAANTGATTEPTLSNNTIEAQPAAAVAEINGTNYTTLEEAFANAQDGQTITLLADCAGNGIKAPQGEFATGLTVDFANHTYTVAGETVGSTGTETNGFQLLKDNTITFKNGTITSAKAKILVQNYSNLTLEGMTLTLNNPNYTGAYTLSNNNGDVVIDSTTITANPAGGFAFDVCRYSSYPSVHVTVQGDSVINGDVEISASGSDAKDGFHLTLSSGTLNGNIVMDASAVTAMENSASGKVSITKAAEFNAAAPTGYKWEGNTTLTKINGVAAIGDTGYTSLEAAFAAAVDGNTITLLADCVGNGIKVPQGKYAAGLTVNFNGHTYTVNGTTVGSTGTETQGFQLLKDNKITFQNGTITGSSITTSTLRFLIQNYSDLTLNNMTLSLVGKYYNQFTLSNNNGTVVIKDSKVSAPTYGGKIRHDVGSYAFDVCRYSSYPSVSVEVTGNSQITGDVKVSASNNEAKEGLFLKLNGGSIVDGNIVLADSAKAVLGSNPNASITKQSDFDQAAPEGYKWSDVDEHNIQTLEKLPPVARIGSTEYTSFVDAVTAANSDGNCTITILADIDFSQGEYADYKWVGSNYHPIEITGDNVVLDLNGHRFYNMGNFAIAIGHLLAKDGRTANVTVMNGRLEAGQTNNVTNSYVLGIAGADNAKVINVVTDGGINICTGTTATTITNSTINGTKYYAVCAQTGSNVTIENSTITKNTDSSVATKAMFWVQGAGTDSDCVTGSNPTGAFDASAITIKSGSCTVDSTNQGVFYLASGIKPVVEGGTFNIDPTDKGLASGYTAVENTPEDGKWTVKPAVAVTDEKDVAVDVKDSDSAAAVSTSVTNETIKEAITNTNTTVEGVQLTTTNTVDDNTSGLQAVINAAKSGTNTHNETAASSAIETASSIEVKVNVAVTLTGYNSTSSQETATFSLTPTATVTTKDANGSTTAIISGVQVDNEMIDQTQDITVTLYTGFEPVQLIHKDGDTILEYFNKGKFDYANGVVTLTIHHFSDLVASATMSNTSPYHYSNLTVDEKGIPTAPAVAVAVDNTLFCGWYVDEEYDTPITSINAPITDAYAKFIDPSTLTVGIQVRQQTIGTVEGASDIRLITTVPDTKYFDKVGFKLTLPSHGDFVVSNHAFSAPLYDSIIVNGATWSLADFKLMGNITSESSAKLALQTVTGIPERYFNNDNNSYRFEVVPYLITKDGRTVEGTAKYFKGLTNETVRTVVTNTTLEGLN